MYKCECGSLFDKPKTIYTDTEQWDECPQCKATDYSEVVVMKMDMSNSSIENIPYNQMMEEVLKDGWTQEYAANTIKEGHTIWTNNYLYKIAP
jgi:hypothetical protein